MPSIDFKSGLVSSAASSLGTFASGAYSTAIKPALDMAKSYANTTFSPAEEPGGNWVNDMAMGLLQAHKNQFSKAAQSYDQGNYTESAGHALAGAVPFVGPAAAATGETIGRGEYAKGLGEAAGLIGGALIGKGKAVTRASRVGRVADEGALVSKVAEDAPRPLPDWAREAGPTPSPVSIRQGPPMTTAELDAKYAAKTGEPRSFLDPDTYTPQDSAGLKAASEGTRVNQALDAVNRTEASAKLRNKPAPPAAERPTIAEDEPPATISKVESDRAANAYMRRGFGLRPTEPGPEVQVNPPARESLSSLADESAESYTNRLAKQVGPNQVHVIDQAIGKKATAADVRDAARGALWRDYGVREMENKPGAPSGVQPEASVPGLTDPETTTTAQNYLNALGKKSDMLKLKKMEDAINASSMSERAKIDEIERLREDAGVFKAPHKPIKIEEMPQDFSKQTPDSIKNKDTSIPPAQIPSEGPLFGGDALKIAAPLGAGTALMLASTKVEGKDKGFPGKTDIKPYDPEKMKFDIVTADDKGTPRYLPPEQDKMVKNLINSMAPEQVPTGGLIFVPENKYKDIQKQINHGTLFGKKITTQNEENFAPGADSLGDGFSLPAYRRTYLNAALLNNPKKLEYVLAHELGHNAAWLSKQNKPDFSETGADEFKDAYLKRGQMTRKNWDAIQHLHGALMGE